MLFIERVTFLPLNFKIVVQIANFVKCHLIISSLSPIKGSGAGGTTIEIKGGGFVYADNTITGSVNDGKFQTKFTVDQKY